MISKNDKNQDQIRKEIELLIQRKKSENMALMKIIKHMEGGNSVFKSDIPAKKAKK